jgi:hypothetical protein
MSDNPFDEPKPVSGAGYSGATAPNTTLAMTSMILGIAGIVLDCCCWPLGAGLGIAAIITGVIGLNKVKDGTGGGKGMALAGVICGVAAILLGIASLIGGLVLNRNMPDILERMQQMQPQNMN